ncbi:DUF3667 domain-containing protein [Chryseobacterium paridis]|uniref:DUF3667 domain-containing protein n=1 Tax=Chryseobacterium paridis TaxID=2800328 RepID=A0ABS1FWI8_9FLAO|nr:DUF3667 domain-containing protein [Chryseobacterium paridis]MBK1896811.1 DUF3667 domain-containing protein [Chryseobacterium paridis]
MNKKSCLNCGYTISDEFCAHCGQKTDTARITYLSLIKNDIFGSIWHVETRFFKTIKNVLLEPGKTAMDYISGKRIRYYNFISLLLILFSFNVLALHFYEKFVTEETIHEVSKIRAFFSKYSKTILFVIIPMLAINAFFVFKKTKLNLAEHFIIGTVSLLGILVIFLLDDIVSFIGLWKPISKITDVVDKIIFVLFILFPAATYWNAFRKMYSKLGLIGRVSVLYVLMGIESLAIITVLYKIF